MTGSTHILLFVLIVTGLPDVTNFRIPPGSPNLRIRRRGKSALYPSFYADRVHNSAIETNNAL